MQANKKKLLFARCNMKEHVIINRLTIQTLSNIQAAAKLHLYTDTHSRTLTHTIHAKNKAKLSTVRCCSQRRCRQPTKKQNANKQSEKMKTEMETRKKQDEIKNK